MRNSWIFIHRWFGLITAAFLVNMGITGAILSWGYEIDAWLNPELYDSSTAPGPFLTGQQLAAIVEADDPRAVVTSMPLVFQKGHPAILEVRAKRNPTTSGLQTGLGYGQVFVDPTTGRIMGKRDIGNVGLGRRRFIPLIYYMHYTWGIAQPNWWYARRLSALIGLTWAVNCLIGFYATMPKAASKPAPPARTGASTGLMVAEAQRPKSSFWRRWKPAWKIVWNKGGYRTTFDLHRAFALWVFALLFMQAISATGTMHVVQRNLILPVLALFSSHQTPGPFVGVYADLGLHGPFGITSRPRMPPQHPVKGEPTVTFTEAIQLANAEAARRGWTVPAGRILYTTGVGGEYTGNASVYRVRFFEPGGDNRFTPNISSNRIKEIYIDGVNGNVVGDRVPWHGTVADVVMQQIFPFHSSLVYGYWGRVVASILGTGTAMLSITGFVIWLNKRQSRVKFKSAKERAAKSRPLVIEQQPGHALGAE